MKRFVVILASGFGVGFIPIAPGTMGTLLAIPIYLFFSAIPFPPYELTLIAFFFLASWISGSAQQYWRKRDDQRIVIDEMMGFFLTMLWVPKTFLFIFLGFILFRFFDIVKPPPIRRMERFRRGFGVVLDDVLAGVYANVLLHLIHFISRKANWL